MSQEFLYKELDYHGNLNKLHEYCEAFSEKPRSYFDPLTKVSDNLRIVLKSLDIIIRKHISFYDVLKENSNTWQIVNIVFNDDSLLLEYDNVLTISTSLIFNKEISEFRNSARPEFLQLILGMYSHINSIAKDSENNGYMLAGLKALLDSFEINFFDQHNSTENINVHCTQARNLLSYSTNPVAIPNIDIVSSIRKGQFRLDIPRIECNRLLVELYQLNDGSLAILKPSCDQLCTSAKGLISGLIEGDYNLMNTDRHLFLSPIKANDLRIREYYDNGIVFTTTIRNDTLLRLTCLDSVSWEKTWKPQLEYMFDESRAGTSPFLGNSCPKLITANSLPEEIYKTSDLKKMKSLQKETTITEGDSLQDHIYEIRSKKSSPVKQIKKSKPLTSPLSSITNLNLPINGNLKKLNQETNCKLISEEESDKSLAEIEYLSYERLVELDKSIEMDITPILSPSPSDSNIKSTYQPFTLDRATSIRSSQGQVSDIESIISELEEGIETDLTFNPSVEEYKPSLHRKGSNSLLSLFRTRSNARTVANSNKSSVDSFSAPHAKPLFSSVDDNQSRPLYVKESDLNDTSNNYILFENAAVKLSFWDGHGWDQIGDKPLEVVIRKQQNNKITFVAYSDRSANECQLIANVSPNWNCLRSAAQDIQLKIPPDSYIACVLQKRNYTITLRCQEADRLYNVLQHCIKDNVHISLSASSTLRTLSTTGSTFSNEFLNRSTTDQSISSNESILANNISRLLLSNIKVKHHSLQPNKTWKANCIGKVDIYTEEVNEKKVTVKVILTNSTTVGVSKSTFKSPLKCIKRIGRTGIALQDSTGYQLLEFINQPVADHVFKLII